jgi:hypothetical protein
VAWLAISPVAGPRVLGEAHMKKAAGWNPRLETNEFIFAACARFMDELGAKGGNGPALKSRASRESTNDKPPSQRVARKAKKLGPAAAVADWLKREQGRPATREKIYPLLWEAFRRKILVLEPPPEEAVAEKVLYRYGLEQYLTEDADLTPIRVVNVHGHEAHGHVAAAGARLVISLIKRLGKKKSRVHIGLGPGVSARRVAERVGRLLAYDDECPNLKIHALSSGGLTLDHPAIMPVTFFSCFDEARADVQYTGLFTEAVVWCKEYDRLIQNPSVRRAFDEKADIDIVITTFNAAYSPEGKPHNCGILANYLNEWDEGAQTRTALKRAGWVGDVQFLPYSEAGPIRQTAGIRTVALFELDELAEMARQEDKYVVLLAGPCRECHMTRAPALRPLLALPRLRVWTHVVTDIVTAQTMLRMPRDVPPGN